MDLQAIAKDPIVREIMKDTATQAKMETWAHALMTSEYVRNDPDNETERDCAFAACAVLFNVWRQIIQPRVVSKYEGE
jgi:hypothetical protein